MDHPSVKLKRMAPKIRAAKTANISMITSCLSWCLVISLFLFYLSYNFNIFLLKCKYLN